MACIHNQAKINELNEKINDKISQISSIEKLKIDVNKIIENHEKYVGELDCVVNNLEGNTVVANQEFDNGEMTVCIDEAKEEILRCEAILKSSSAKIESLGIEIDNLNNQITTLQGDCDYCIAIQLQAQKQPEDTEKLGYKNE